jgi:Cytochrome C oxidase, cbb3-type, subunit III
MRYWFPLLSLAVGPLLICRLAVAQNPCSYAFSISGQKIFEDHCAGCHGLDGKGKGPLASNQTVPPADLTELKRMNKGNFPAQRVLEIIRTGGDLLGHDNGPIMPSWGKVFNRECGPAYSRHAVVELKRYLETIQK